MKRARPLMSILVLLLTAGFFVYYLAHHPTTLTQLRQIKLVYALPILALYLIFTAFLSVAVRASVKLCSKEISSMESFRLTASSALANFFGPLQSGPGVRALYLKQKHGVSIKKFGLATLYYYGFYAVVSGLLLISSDPKFRIPLAVLFIAGTIGTVWFLKKRSKEAGESKFNVRALAHLGVATTLQLACTVAIYYLELVSLGQHVSLGQVMGYSGAANFALFVSLTPGAIGFREAFLVFSQSLHHIGQSTIVAANLIDRSLYVLFLGLLFIWLAVFHAKKRLKSNSAQKS